MMQFVVGSERLAKVLYKSNLADKIIRYDLRKISEFSDEDLLAHIYRRVGIEGGVTKQTGAGRFAPLDEITVRLLAEMEAPRLHDVGVSSGITSVELLETAAAKVTGLSLVVSDKFSQFYWKQDGARTDIYDAERRLQCSYMGILFGDQHSSAKYPLSRWLHKQAQSSCCNGESGFLLFHPKLLAKLKSGTVEAIDYDVLQADRPAEYAYVRCMNLLNHSYFSEPDLQRGIVNLCRSLTSGGVLQIGRTEQNGDNHVSFYRIANGEISCIETFGQGSEIHDLVMQTKYQ